MSDMENKIADMLNRFRTEIQYVYGYILSWNGNVISSEFAAPIQKDTLRYSYSISKSLTSLATGIVLEDGLLRLDDRVTEFLRAELPLQYDSRLDAMTIRDLLTMRASSAAYRWDFATGPSDRWLRDYFALTPYAQPGTEFHYDTGAYYALSCIISKVTGRNIHALLRERVFDPLGVSSTHWLTDACGRNTGGWGAYVHVSDGLRIMQMLMDDGCWKGRQIVPEWYVRELRTHQTDTSVDPGPGWKYGYGYGFWLGKSGAFVAFGAYGQLWICHPDKRLILLLCAGCSFEQAPRLLDIVEETLLSEGKVPESKCCDAFLGLPQIDGWPESSHEAAYWGTYQLGDNPYAISSLGVSKEGENILLSFGSKGKTHCFRAGFNRWITRTAQSEASSAEHAFSYAWENDDTLIIRHFAIADAGEKTGSFTFGKTGFVLTIKNRLTSEAPPVVLTGSRIT